MQARIELQKPGPDKRNLPTWFAPAERADAAQIEREASCFLEVSPLLCEILDAVPDILVALNAQRHIIFANRGLLALLQVSDQAVLGLRPGEALDCTHSGEPGGCGTSEFCSVCGAVQAIVASQAGKASLQECRIVRRNTGEALDFRVMATPLHVGDKQFTLLTLSDISDEKRRRALERIFFHDVLNTATAMRASADMLRRAGGAATGDLPDLLRQLSERMIDEITMQRQLTDAENDELLVLPGPIAVPALLQGLADTYRHHEVAQGRTLCVAEPLPDVFFVSDRTLVRRVLGNMLKNALEASPVEATVTVGCEERGDGVEFWVHNPTSMPREVQLQVFQRSYSTKGPGRGLGTYSMRLLTERYLAGRVWFTTSETRGTTFRAHYPHVLAQN